jgi:hypothetical protein
MGHNFEEYEIGFDANGVYNIEHVDVTTNIVTWESCMQMHYSISKCSSLFSVAREWVHHGNEFIGQRQRPCIFIVFPVAGEFFLTLLDRWQSDEFLKDSPWPPVAFLLVSVSFSRVKAAYDNRYNYYLRAMIVWMPLDNQHVLPGCDNSCMELTEQLHRGLMVDVENDM